MRVSYIVRVSGVLQDTCTYIVARLLARPVAVVYLNLVGNVTLSLQCSLDTSLPALRLRLAIPFRKNHTSGIQS